MDIYKSFFRTNNHKTTQPPNYQKVDDFMSRSAQPSKSNIDWLQENNITDIVNFRRDNESFPLDFDECKYVESKSMNYHHITYNSEIIKYAEYTIGI